MKHYWAENDLSKEAWDALQTKGSISSLNRVLKEWKRRMQSYVNFEGTIGEMSPCLPINCTQCIVVNANGTCNVDAEGNLSRFVYLNKLRNLYGGDNAEEGDKGVTEGEVATEPSEAMPTEVGLHVPQRVPVEEQYIDPPNYRVDDTRNARSVLSEQTLRNAIESIDQLTHRSAGAGIQVRGNVQGVGRTLWAGGLEGVQYPGAGEAGPGHTTEWVYHDGAVGQGDAGQQDE